MYIVALFAVTACVAEDWTQSVIADADRSVDFKTVAKGTKTEHRFVLNNPFQETLHLKSVLSNCVCTTPILEDEKNDIPTYDAAVITARFNSDLFNGQKNATISVVIDAPKRAEILLNVFGDVRNDITIKPDSVRYGQVKFGEEHARSLNITYTGPNSNWRILDVKSGNSNIHAEVVDTQTQLGKKTFKIAVKLSGQAPRGHIDEHIYLITNDSAVRREIPVLVQATVGSVITVTPPTVFLGSFKIAAQPPVKNAVLRGTEPFKIKKITCDNPAISVPFDIQPDASPKVMYMLPIRYQGTEQVPKDGTLQAFVKVETDNTRADVQFYVMGKIVASDE